MARPAKKPTTQAKRKPVAATRKVLATSKPRLKSAKSTKKQNRFRSSVSRIGKYFMKPVYRLKALRSRRTHKSFALSRRRDYKRALEVPGYFAFTGQVAGTLMRNRKLFLALSVTMALLALVLSGLTSYQLYESMVESAAIDGVELPALLQAGSLAASTAGLLSAGGGEVQQIYLAIIGLVVWLTTVWLLREILAGQRPRLRHGLYSSGSPIVATAIVALLLLLQLIPAGILALIYVALSTTGLISGGLGAFLFAGVSVLVVALTLYWATSTLLAMVIITLPGMYPWRAMRAASDIVVGRRLRLLYRIIWMLVLVVITWLAVMVPVVLLDGWARGVADWFKYVPLVPVVSTWLTMVLVVWGAAYVYMLYRKVVASDAESSS